METSREVTLETRQRILETAGEVFAEEGFRHGTVREICRRAGANVAAVNYYFGSKERLYVETLRFWREVAFRHLPYLDPGSEGPAEERLGTFIRMFLTGVFQKGEVAPFGRLVAREYIQPTHALDMLMDETIRPTYELLSGVIRELGDFSGNDESVRLVCASIVGQCLFYVYARPVITRLYSDMTFGAGEMEVIAAHVTKFSLHAIKGMVNETSNGGH